MGWYKMNEKTERDKKGQFQKGHKGAGGRPKGTIKDITCADGKKRSVAALVDDLLGAYATMGGGKFLAKWATANHRNLTKFIDILYKFAPMPVVGDDREFKPLTVQVTNVIGDKRTEQLGTYSQSHQGLQDQLEELRKELRKKDNEIERFKGIFKDHDIDPGVIEHTPVRDELPGHEDDETEDELDHSDRRYR